MENKRIAIIRIRGNVGVKKEIKDTLNMLHLYRKNYCSLILNTKSNIGMLNLIKDYVTWGEVDEETCKLLLEKRGRLYGNKKLLESYIKEKINLSFNDFIKEFMEGKKELKDIPGLKKFFRLNPPLKGFERKGIKIPFSLGGALGYRKEKINDLIRRMV